MALHGNLALPTEQTGFTKINRLKNKQMKKEQVLQTINQMGKDIDINVFLEKLIFIDKIEKGLMQLENNETVNQSDVESYFTKKWKK